jgi:hypothetical protein
VQHEIVYQRSLSVWKPVGMGGAEDGLGGFGISDFSGKALAHHRRASGHSGSLEIRLPRFAFESHRWWDPQARGASVWGTTGGPPEWRVLSSPASGDVLAPSRGPALPSWWPPAIVKCVGYQAACCH